MERLLPRHQIPEAGALDPEAWFGRTAPVVLEIGSGHGAAAVAYAAAHPEHDLLAVEVHVPGVARMLAAAEPLGVRQPLGRAGRRDATAHRPGPHGSLAAVHLFFPDPWPKAKHAKRRFVAAAHPQPARRPPGARRGAADRHGPRRLRRPRPRAGRPPRWMARRRGGAAGLAAEGRLRGQGPGGRPAVAEFTLTRA